MFERGGIRSQLDELVSDPLGKFGEIRNYMFAQKPRFVIIGTGRSGTTFTSAALTRAGIPVSHERYFTYGGPRLRHPYRDWSAIGDSSWCAVPFLPDEDIIALHQVRHPYKVIGSFYKIGFFDPRHEEVRAPYVALAKQYFEFSDDPLRSCLRWYAEWNERCEAITSNRFRIEHFADHLEDIERWLGLPVPPSALDTATDTNTRKSSLEEPVGDLEGRLREFPEFADLEAMCERYGYDL